MYIHINEKKYMEILTVENRFAWFLILTPPRLGFYAPEASRMGFYASEVPRLPFSCF